MSRQSLAILDHIISEKPARENRLIELLKDPRAETCDGWFMCVPPCFNDALDIKLTQRVENKKKTLMWTQGGAFAFQPGDTIYDSPGAYKVWSEALRVIGLCVQVKRASSAGIGEGGADRSAGSVTFSVMTPNEDRTRIIERGEHTMSQDDFVRFLIGGPPEELKQKIGMSR